MYHIGTMLIDEYFNGEEGCPVCRIKRKIDERLTDQYLGEGVMEDNTRIKVGKLGFCAKHVDMLLSRQNKLSVALQLGTRTEKLLSLMGNVKNVRQARKQAEAIKKASSTCVLCDYVEESMVKYYKTIAQMFEKEKDFLGVLVKSKGFCLHHYAELLKYSNYAGFLSNEYVNIISTIETRNIERLQAELKKFCDKHDYRNALEPLGNAETALPRMREKLYGKKID
jgi:hypothetical protein